jgi:hypothetical protein
MAKRKITEDSFVYVEHPQSELYGIQIRKGRYKNVIFTFGKVKMEEDKEHGQCYVNFNYAINRGSSRFPKDELKDNVKFKEHIADILIYILENHRRADVDEHTEISTKEDL